MGEMVIRDLDDAMIVELSEMAVRRGLSVEALAAELLRRALNPQTADRSAVARAIQAAQPRRSRLDSVELIREDRHRR